jgi:CRP/FNR family transcriptional regulator, cyclic AMP receptor protein
MDRLLEQTELFDGLTSDEFRQLTGIGRRRTLRAGEYLFLLGEDAVDFSVVTKGNVDLCFPMPLGGEVKDISIESLGEGKPLGWSALVKPYRFTLSARATQVSEVVSFARMALIELFEHEPRLGHTFFMRISELVGIRLETFQALWVRELRRLAERPTKDAAGVRALRGGQ